MDRFGLILAVAAVTFATRLAGFMLATRNLPSVLDRFLHFVPVAVFATLVVPGVAVDGGELPARLVGAILATIAVMRFRRLWAGLLVGMAGYWLIRWLGGDFLG